MITVDEAIKKIKKENPKTRVIGISETDNEYVIVMDNDDEGYKTVNKNTGQLSFMWFWEYMELSKDGKTKELKLERVS